MAAIVNVLKTATRDNMKQYEGAFIKLLANPAFFFTFHLYLVMIAGSYYRYKNSLISCDLIEELE
ncbi:MAG: hypothetical protein GX044_09675 [Firmicutes bacterium]|nr:hypothetical protein [Bacillota bacterium]